MPFPSRAPQTRGSLKPTFRRGSTSSVPPQAFLKARSTFVDQLLGQRHTRLMRCVKAFKGCRQSYPRARNQPGIPTPHRSNPRTRRRERPNSRAKPTNRIGIEPRLDPLLGGGMVQADVFLFGPMI